jgi:hypothetical protein
MAEKKSIIEEALLDIKNIQKALNANTKEILRSVAKEEIDSVVKESINEIYDEEDMDSPEGETELGGMADAATDDIDAPELGDEESADDELVSLDGSEEVEPEMEPELGMNADALGGDLDMTAASDDDVIAIYKKLSGDDEIEIVGDEIHLNISEPGEYVVKTNGSSLGGAETETDMDMDMDDMDMEMGGEESDDTEYEIEMGDEESDDMDMEMGDEESDEDAPADLVSVDDEEGVEGEEEEEEEEVEELTEQIPVGNAQARRLPGINTPIKGAGAKSLDESASRKLVLETTKKYNTLLTEAKKLKSENEEFRKSLKMFRTQLVETVVFNSNLTYVTKLFTEHSTTKAEKERIIQRFDNEVSNLKESKKLYHAIGKELESRKPIAESVQNKIIKEATTGVSKQLTESTAYVDPSTSRILELMKRVDKK